MSDIPVPNISPKSKEFFGASKRKPKIPVKFVDVLIGMK
jgi:hypothetical protein